MEKTIQRIYQIAGIYGLLVLVPQLFIAEQLFAPYPPEITHKEFMYGFTLVAIAWQVTFFLIASDVKRYRLIMLGTILEKAGFGFLCLYLYFFKEIMPNVFMGGMVDLAFMFAFIFAYLKTEKI